MPERPVLHEPVANPQQCDVSVAKGLHPGRRGARRLTRSERPSSLPRVWFRASGVGAWSVLSAGAVALGALLSCTQGAPTSQVPSPARQWRSCEAASDCAVVIGQAGWPAAINARHELDYLGWVQSQAPFTTYFAPGDCFAEDAAFRAYVSRSESSLACTGGQCVLGVEATCAETD